METSLHRELKILYAGRKARFEVPWEGGYRIDAVVGSRLIEIQHSSLAAIRDKIVCLLEAHPVTIVKPIVATRMLVKQTARGGEVIGRRLSPKRGKLLDLFDELVHFTRVFPHPRLTLEVLLVDVEEWRFPGHGRRRRWRENDHEVEDERLVSIQAKHRLRTAADLTKLVRKTAVDFQVPDEFHTGDLAQSLSVPRWMAQRIAYCLVRMEQLKQVGQQGNARLYRWVRSRVGRVRRVPP